MFYAHMNIATATFRVKGQSWHMSGRTKGNAAAAVEREVEPIQNSLSNPCDIKDWATCFFLLMVFVFQEQDP